MTHSIKLVKEIGLKDKTILDIGCGYGWFEYHALMNNAKSIIGIEITEKDLATAKTNITDSRAEFKIAGALKIPSKSSTFDVAVAWEVIEHIPKSTENVMFEEICRTLKPGGIFLLSTPFASFSSRLLDPAWWLIGHRHYSQEQLISYGLNVGLEIVNITPMGGIWASLSSLNMYVSKWIFRRSPIMYAMFTRKERAEYSKIGGTSSIFAVYRKPTMSTRRK